MCIEDKVFELLLPPICANPLSVFYDNESSEARAYFTQYEAVEKIWKDLLANPNLYGCCFEDRDGRKLFLTPSIINPDWWQLTVFGVDGIPSYHEDYARNRRGEETAHRMAELFDEMTRRSLKHSVLLKIHMKEEKTNWQKKQF